MNRADKAYDSENNHILEYQQHMRMYLYGKQKTDIQKRENVITMKSAQSRKEGQYCSSHKKTDRRTYHIHIDKNAE